MASALLGIENANQLKLHPLRGALFENMIVVDFLKNRYNQGKLSNLYFWRDSLGREVDLLIENHDGLVPIEIKSGQTILEWCQNGEEEVVIADKIVQCESLDELMSLYRQYPTECQDNKSVFIAKRQSLLQAVPESQTTLKTINYEHNTIAAS